MGLAGHMPAYTGIYVLFAVARSLCPSSNMRLFNERSEQPQSDEWPTARAAVGRLVQNQRNPWGRERDLQSCGLYRFLTFLRLYLASGLHQDCCTNIHRLWVY